MFRVRIAYITENNKKIISDSSKKKFGYCLQMKILVICLNDVHGTWSMQEALVKKKKKRQNAKMWTGRCNPNGNLIYVILYA